MKSSRFFSRSSLVLTSAFGLSVLVALGTQFAIADTIVPYKTPPTGNVSPTFSSVETFGDITAGGALKVGSAIMPKQGSDLTLQATNVAINGNLQLGGQNFAPVLKSNGPLAFEAATIQNYLIQPDPAKFNQTGRVTVQNPFLTGPVTMDDSIYMMKNTFIRADKITSESMSTGSVSTLKTQDGKLIFGDINAGNLTATGMLNASKSLVGGYISTYDLSKSAVPTSVISPQGLGVFSGIISTTGVYAPKIGDWKMKENDVDLFWLATNSTHFSSSCDAGYKPVSCNAYFDDNGVLDSGTYSLALSGTSFNQIDGGSCNAHIRMRNSAKAPPGQVLYQVFPEHTHLKIQTLCYRTLPPL